MDDTTEMYPEEDDNPREGTHEMHSVAIYEVHQMYGGPEEGGWWYDAGEPIKHHFEELGELGLPKFFLVKNGNEDEMHEHLSKVQKALDDNVNKFRPPLHSVNSTGVYKVRSCLGYPEPYPAVTPHYE